jgi:hypothetical protein
LNFFAPLFCFKTKKWKRTPLGGTEKKKPLANKKPSAYRSRSRLCGRYDRQEAALLAGSMNKLGMTC